MAKTWKEENWHCISVISNGLHDIDDPWEWCKETFGPNTTWKYNMDKISNMSVNYYFKFKEHAVQFQLTWG